MDGSTSGLRPVRIFVMSPKDVHKERARLKEIVTLLDSSYARSLGLTLELIGYEDVTSDMGKPQAVTNREVFAKPVDIFVGVMWSQFGTPSGGVDAAGVPYPSGTLEEYEYARSQRELSTDGWPAIAFYRCRRPYPNDASGEQIDLVQRFFRELKQDGRYPQLLTSYRSLKEFGDRVNVDLVKILQRYHTERVQPAPRPAPPADGTVPADWERRYRERLREDLQRIPMPLPGSRSAGLCDLDDVYVPLELHHVSARTPDPIDDRRLLAFRRAVLTGAAGSGKSTLLRRAALLQLAEPGVPVLVSLVDAWARLRETVAADGIAARDWFPVLALETSLTERQVESRLEQGGVLLLFDRLDEVPDPRHRQALVAGIDRLQKEFSSIYAPNHVLLACRSAAWRGSDWVNGFDEVRIKAMSTATRDAYLSRWCDRIWGADGSRSLGRVHRAIRDSGDLAELAANPQVATMLAHVAAQAGIPGQRVRFYDLYVATVAAAERVRRHGDAGTVRDHLVALAHAMQTRGDDGVLGVREAERVLDQRTGGGAGRELLDDLELHTDLLTVDRLYDGDPRATVRFRHRTFQEFLAARHFARHPDELLGHPNVLDGAWLETLTMTAGLLALEGPPALEDFLAELAGAPGAGAGGAALVAWAPRVAAASACTYEVASFDLPPERLAPARQAQDAILPALPAIDVVTRVSIADGLGSVRDPRLTPEARWVEIPAGSFVRGSAAPDAWEQERPAAEVTLSAYRIQRWAVTVGEYARFMGEGDGYVDDAWWLPAGREWRAGAGAVGPLGWERQRRHSNRPVVGVSWWEALAYARWFTASAAVPEGWVARLPTESEWEKAARGPSPRRFPWGDEWRADAANCLPLTVGVSPVGLFRTGEDTYDVWDLAGNVGERCLDGFGAYDAEPGPDPVGASATHGHVVRGGDWASYPMDVRTTSRFGAAPGARDDRTGFRVVLVPAGHAVPRELVR